MSQLARAGRVTRSSRQRNRQVTKLHPKQMEVRNTRARFKVVVAGRRWGKTELAKSQMIEFAAKNKGKMVWYIAPSFQMAKQIMWMSLVKSVPKQWVKKKNEAEMRLILKNGSIIQCKSADNPDSLRGVSLQYAVLDEIQDMSPEVWYEAIRPTLVDSGGDAMMIGTPKSYNLLYELYTNGQSDNPEWQSWQFPTISSPFIPPSEIEQAKQDMDDKTFRQEFEASFESVSGRVYHSFDRKKHVGDYKFNPDLPIWVGQDFNVDPMSTVVMQPQKNGEVWIVDEIIRDRSSVVDVSNELERRYWRHKSKISIFPDPSGNNRQHARGETSFDIFRDAGFKKIIFKKKAPLVADRINSVNRMFSDAKGEARLFIDRSCKKTIKSFEQTIFKEGAPEVDKRGGVEHATDAVGYPIEYKFPIKKVKLLGTNL